MRLTDGRQRESDYRQREADDRQREADTAARAAGDRARKGAREKLREREKDVAAREEAQIQREVKAAARAHELEAIRLRGERQPNQDNRSATKVPKLPCFHERKYNNDSFGQRFDANNFREDEWATS